MTRKRFKKLMMAQGMSRNEADTNREVTHWQPLPLAPKGE
jgi:hypothetical protein